MDEPVRKVERGRPPADVGREHVRGGDERARGQAPHGQGVRVCPARDPAATPSRHAQLWSQGRLPDRAHSCKGD